MTTVTITRELAEKLLAIALDYAQDFSGKSPTRILIESLAGKLRAALDEPQAITDTQRLDWLDRQSWVELRRPYREHPFVIKTPWTALRETRIRAAIDAAIQQEKQ